jgi:hypothetical protein
VDTEDPRRMTVMNLEDRPGQRITGRVTEVSGWTETGIAWHGMAWRCWMEEGQRHAHHDNPA